MSRGYVTFRHEVDPWTVGQLRAALTGLPDSLPVRVNVAESPGGDFVDEQVVIGVGFGWADWGGDRGEEIDSFLTISCEFPPGDYERPA